jgi:DNA helicase-2/ATP-dependent DNA helicase PcrA
MIYLPLAWNLTAKDYQLVVVDEAQDMTAAQLEIAQRVCNGRICVVGDDRQAIYGFRGATAVQLTG